MLAKQPRPRGPRLTIVTNAGGPGVLATDALVAGGGELAALSREKLAAPRRGPAPRRGATAIRSTCWATPTPSGTRRRWRSRPQDPDSDGLLVILTPQDMTDPTRTAEALRQLRAHRRQAGARELDGRRRGGRRRRHPEPRRHPDVRVSRTPPPAPSVTCGATPTTCGRSTRRPTPRRRRRRATRRRRARSSSRRARRGGTLLDEPRRSGAREPTASPPSRPGSRATEAEAVAAARRARLPGRAQALVADDHAQDRRRRREAGPRRRRGGARARSATSSAAPSSKAGAGRLPGRDRPADGRRAATATS